MPLAGPVPGQMVGDLDSARALLRSDARQAHVHLPHPLLVGGLGPLTDPSLQLSRQSWSYCPPLLEGHGIWGWEREICPSSHRSHGWAWDT